jgi:hypothetical protein
MGKLGLNSGYIGSDQRTTTNGVVGYDKYYLERRAGRFIPVLGFDVDYQAILNYAIIQGYTLPSASQQLLQNQLVLDLKAGGIWSKLDTFAIFATDGSSDFALIDWKRLSLYTAFNSPTFTANEGFEGNGTSSYIDLNYETITDWVNVSQDNVCLFTNNLANTSVSLVVGSASPYVQMTFQNASNNFSTRLHSATLGAVPSLGITGRLYNSRNNSSNYDFYFNGNFEGTASTTTSLVTTALFLFRQTTNYFPTKTSYVGYGAYLNATEIGDLDNALDTYLTLL